MGRWKILVYLICITLTVVFGGLTLRYHKESSQHTSAAPLSQDATSRENPIDTAYTHMLVSGAVLLFSFCGLAMLFARDVSALMGTKAGSLYYAEDEFSDTSRNAVYEQADQAWNDGDHLEAIRLLRLYLQNNPREQHAALRIAEIYEKDLGNYLAAALELEEVLKSKLRPDRWGWTAIRLSNLYTGKLRQTDKAVNLLQQLVEKYPDTKAADKARRRLAMMEQSDNDVIQEETNVI